MNQLRQTSPVLVIEINETDAEVCGILFMISLVIFVQQPDTDVQFINLLKNTAVRKFRIYKFNNNFLFTKNKLKLVT